VSETLAHIHLVDRLKKFVMDEYLNGDDGSLLVDSPDGSSNSKTFKINGYRPDLFVKIDSNIVIIGEAKTRHDLDREHSIAQFIAFLEFCSKYNNSMFVLAVPWDLSIYGKNLLKYIQRENKLINVEIVVIDKLVV